MVSRRSFLHSMVGGLALTTASTVLPGLSFSSARTDKRLVVVLLRGGMDSLSALVPYGDSNYAYLRGDLAIPEESLLKIDPFFGLHPSLEPLAQMYKEGELTLFAASASPYRDRSHFDGQNILELGSKRPYGLQSGWLNRAIEQINISRQYKDEHLGLAFAQAMPSILRGPATASSWAPSALPDVGDDFMGLIEKIYTQDPLFADSYARAVKLQSMGMDDGLKRGEERKLARKSRSGQSFVTMAELAGKRLRTADGPRIATLEMGGWDTHVQQGNIGGQLTNNFDLLGRGLKALKDNLGAAWSNTAVLVLTEFGRTVKPNGTNGTDHGTGSMTVLCGGAVKGGKIIHDWPGLESHNLYEGRDLKPTIDIRSVVKSVLHEHYGLSYASIDQSVYPNNQKTSVIHNLIR